MFCSLFVLNDGKERKRTSINAINDLDEAATFDVFISSSKSVQSCMATMVISDDDDVSSNILAHNPVSTASYWSAVPKLVKAFNNCFFMILSLSSSLEVDCRTRPPPPLLSLEVEYSGCRCFCSRRSCRCLRVAKLLASVCHTYHSGDVWYAVISRNGGNDAVETAMSHIALFVIMIECLWSVMIDDLNVGYVVCIYVYRSPMSSLGWTSCKDFNSNGASVIFTNKWGIFRFLEYRYEFSPNFSAA